MTIKNVVICDSCEAEENVGDEALKEWSYLTITEEDVVAVVHLCGDCKTGLNTRGFEAENVGQVIQTQIQDRRRLAETK